MNHYKVTLTFKTKKCPTQVIKLWAIDTINAERDARASAIACGYFEPVKKATIEKI